MNVTMDIWALVNGLPTIVDCVNGKTDELKKLVDHALEYGDVVEVTVWREER